MRKIGVSVVTPVYNEEVDLARNIPKLYSFLKKAMGNYDWEIVIADNASTDRTPIISGSLMSAEKNIKYLRLTKKGRGRALKKAWLNSKKDILSYMDIDLSSDLSYLPVLIKKIEEGYDIAIGSRLAKGAKVKDRPVLREIMSRGYSLLFRTLFWTSFKDAQCGFKAIKEDVAQKLIPKIEDNEWFFDTELLVFAEKSGYKIAEVPISWKDDPNSTVKVAKTAWGNIKGMWRIFWERPWKK